MLQVLLIVLSIVFAAYVIGSIVVMRTLHKRRQAALKSEETTKLLVE